MEIFASKIEWIITSIILIAVNFGVIKTQIKNKIDKFEAIDLIDESVSDHFNQCQNSHSAFSNVNGAILKTKVENIEKTLDIMTKDIKSILGKVGQ